MFFKMRCFLFSAAAPLCPACATVFAMAGLIPLTGESAQADISAYAKDVTADATNTFLTTNASTSPEPVNIGTLAGNNTYEFIVNAKADLTSSDALMGVGDGGEAIKFDQFPDSGDYGATIYTVADYRFNVQETLGTPVVLDFVAHPAAGTTQLFVDGVDTGSSVPFAVALSGEVGLGASIYGNDQFTDEFNGTILAAATYNSSLSASEIAAHSNAYFATVPEPPTLAMLAAGAIGLLGYHWRRRRATRTVQPAAIDHDAPPILSFLSHSSPASAARRAA